MSKEWMQPKAVVVRVMKNNVPIHRSVHRFAEDIHIRPFMESVKVIYPTSETHVINVREVREPDTKAVKEKGQLWCPYCHSYRHFTVDSNVGTTRCIICGISTNDFDVKTYNNLWPKIAAADLRRDKKK